MFLFHSIMASQGIIGPERREGFRSVKDSVQFGTTSSSSSNSQVSGRQISFPNLSIILSETPLINEIRFLFSDLYVSPYTKVLIRTDDFFFIVFENYTKN